MLDDFNALPAQTAEDQLLAVCASPEWAGAVAGVRPYRDLDALLTTAEAAFVQLTWADVAKALAAHPRIGQRPAGSSPEAAWSRREQAGVRGAEAELDEVNRAYEARFGHLFLIFASGKSAAEILAAAKQRLGNDEATEHAIVREELRKIIRLRLERLVTG